LASPPASFGGLDVVLARIGVRASRHKAHLVLSLVRIVVPSFRPLEVRPGDLATRCGRAEAVEPLAARAVGGLSDALDLDGQHAESFLVAGVMSWFRQLPA